MKPEDKAKVQQALELLDKQWQCSEVWSLEESQESAEALRQLLEQPVQEIVGEVGWAANVPNTIREVRWTDGCPPIGTKLYTTSPIAATPLAQPAAWVGLEKADMPDGDNPMYDHDCFIKGMVWADIKLREKNGY